MRRAGMKPVALVLLGTAGVALAGCCQDAVVIVTTVGGCNLTTNDAGQTELVCTDIGVDTVAVGGGDTVAVGGGDSLRAGKGAD